MVLLYQQIPNRWELRILLQIKDVKLWSPESPHLYDMKIELIRNGESIDAITSLFLVCERYR